MPERCVAVYLASPDEIDLAPAIAALLERGVSVVAPRWNGVTYDLARLGGLSPADIGGLSPAGLRRGPMGILEPKAPDLVDFRAVTIWFVPGLAFTRAGDRLGYGGGWYDRFLAAASPSARKYGVAYSFQVIDEIPSEPHDVRMDGLVGV